MESTLILGIVIVALALGFAFSIGFNDAANVVAVVISSRAMRPRTALIIVGIFEFIGAYFLGTAVAETVGKGIIDLTLLGTGEIGIMIIIATLLAATLWNVFCTVMGFPVSASHALIGGFVGAGIAAAGFNVVQWANVLLIFIVLITSPLIGLVVSFILTRLAYLLTRRAKPTVSKLFRNLEIITTMGAALATGANAAQRPMGIIVFAFISLGLSESTAEFFVPAWVVIACGIAVVLGIFRAGRNVIKTVGMKYYKIRHINGFCAQATNAGIIQLANVFGLPISTTQVTSGAVMGTGAAERIKGVRWGVGRRVLIVWLITMPLTGIVAGLIFLLIIHGARFFNLVS